MKRGELYRVSNPSSRDPKRYRVYVIVSRQVLIESSYSSVICAPVYTAYHGLVTQVQVGPNEGLKHHSSIHCDDLVSLPKAVLAFYVGSLPPSKLRELNTALGKALDIPNINYL